MKFDSLTTRKYNLHSHTQFCDGRHSMEEILRAAIDEGMTLFGFSPHSPVPVDSPCNMSFDDVEPYFDEIQRLRSLYGDQIEILASMEIDYLGDKWGPANPYFDNLPLDYRIGSVHFVPSAIDGTPIDIDGSAERFFKNMAEQFDNNIDYVVNAFFDASEAMVEAGGLDIIGHFDKVIMNGIEYDPNLADSSIYRRRVVRMIDCIASADIAAEINTKAIDTRGRFFPDSSLFHAMKRAGITILVNSDVHFSNLVNAGRDKAFAILDNLSI